MNYAKVISSIDLQHADLLQSSIFARMSNACTADNSVAIAWCFLDLLVTMGVWLIQLHQKHGKEELAVVAGICPCNHSEHENGATIRISGWWLLVVLA